mgnify:FL=1
MERQVFLVRVDPLEWNFKDKEKDWGSIDVGDWVPFGPLEENIQNIKPIKWKEHIDKIRMKDIVIGYTCYEKKCIEALGRVVSNKFDYIDGKRFLIQKTTQLNNPIPRDAIKEILESDRFLKVKQPTVTLVNPEDWDKIKSIILKENNIKEDIEKLESGSDEWYIND